MPLPLNIIIFFTRYPSAGKCKTRLIPALGREGAAQIHKQLVAHTLKTVTTCPSLIAKTAYHIYYDGASPDQMEQWLGTHTFREQQGGCIGKSMTAALLQEIQNGERVILIGSDCPSITSELLRDGFEALQKHDLVLGPAHDGGYYLIGVNNSIGSKTIQQLFKNIPWSSSEVLKTTLQQAKKLQLHFHLLPTLHDIDTPDDLKYFNHHSHPE